MEDISMPTIQPGAYEHYKGNRYQVLGIGRHTETDEPFVVYTPLYKTDEVPAFWLRPYGIFTGDVEVEGKRLPRFRKLE